VTAGRVTLRSTLWSILRAALRSTPWFARQSSGYAGTPDPAWDRGVPGPLKYIPEIGSLA
jgi:hypothetical protein